MWKLIPCCDKKFCTVLINFRTMEDMYCVSPSGVPLQGGVWSDVRMVPFFLCTLVDLAVCRFHVLQM